MIKNKTVGIVANRLVVGFIFAFIYQAITGMATSALDIPLSGTLADLISGLVIADVDPDTSTNIIAWWIISSVMFTMIATYLVRFRRFFSPYKEKGMEIPPDLTLVSVVIMGVIMSALFFALDLVIENTHADNVADVQTIYLEALGGNFEPLTISIVFSLIAGFVVVWVIGRASKVKAITRGIGEVEVEISDIAKKFKRTQEQDSVDSIADTVGMAPGTLVHVGKKRVDKVWFSLIRYDTKRFDEMAKTHDLDECFSAEKFKVNWLNVIGVHDNDAVKHIGKELSLHELRQADIMNTEIRPTIKIEQDKIFMALKMPRFDKNGKIMVEHISLVITKDYVVSFQEAEGDVFDNIRENIRGFVGINMRNKQSDYLVYALLDAIVDNFFAILEEIGTKTEELEHLLMDNPDTHTLETIYDLKRQLITLRKVIWPMREVIRNLERANSPHIHDDTRRYLRDVYDHTVQTMDTIESLRDMVGGMLDTYLSSMSNKMNEVMKTLTIIASIFIPITFIAGIYGTNFSYVPELELEHGYFIMLGLMSGITVIMVIWFRRKAWL